MEPVYEDNEHNLYIFNCPHCKNTVEVLKPEVACTIFRHGYFFIQLPNNQIMLTHQVNPHERKEVCDQLFAEGKIVGCGKPFKFVYGQDGKHHVEICNYI